MALKTCNYYALQRGLSLLKKIKDPFPWITLFFIDFELGPALYSPWGILTGAKKFWPKIYSKCVSQGITFFR